MESASLIIGVGGFISALFAWVPVAKFISDSRRDLRSQYIAEGERRQVILTLKHDIELEQIQINGLDERLSKVEAVTTEMRNDLKHLVLVVDKIANKVMGV